jgi:hypothetical protein
VEEGVKGRGEWVRREVREVVRTYLSSSI